MSNIYGPLGWIDDQNEVEKISSNLAMPFFGQAASRLKGSGDNTIVLLYKCFEKLGIKYVPGVQKIGDCVSFGYGHGTDHLIVSEIIAGERERWPGFATSTEYIYGGSRVWVGGSRNGQRGTRCPFSGDGSVGAWAAKFVKEYGTLTRSKYPEFDLTTYDPNLAKQWGKNGPLTSLIDDSREHVVGEYTLCKNAKDVCDSIANGYPVVVCSGIGFTNKRDSLGFCKRSGSWAHCMCFTAIDTQNKRPGVLCLNSWGRYMSGPTRHGQPEESFWVDLDVVDIMCRQNDTWALSSFDGYKPKTINYQWWK